MPLKDSLFCLEINFSPISSTKHIFIAFLNHFYKFKNNSFITLLHEIQLLLRLCYPTKFIKYDSMSSVNGWLRRYYFLKSYSLRAEQNSKSLIYIHYPTEIALKR